MNTRRNLTILIRTALFQERGKTCELCGVAHATDMHELITRSSVPSWSHLYIPLEFRAVLCNTCNVERADTLDALRFLMQKNATRYGIKRLRAKYLKFRARIGYPLYQIEYVLEELE